MTKNYDEDPTPVIIGDRRTWRNTCEDIAAVVLIAAVTLLAALL